jgi:hypothetical protein
MTPAATARSCDAAHAGRPVGSAVGDGLAVALGAMVTGAIERVAAGGDAVAVTLAGAAQDASVAARSHLSIGGR